MKKTRITYDVVIPDGDLSHTRTFTDKGKAVAYFWSVSQCQPLFYEKLLIDRPSMPIP